MTGIETSIALVAENVAYKVAAQLSVGFVTKLWHSVFPPKSYIQSLTKVINKSIDEFEIHQPYNGDSTKFPFYHSQLLFEHLLGFVIFKEDRSKEIRFEFEKNPNITIPTKEELQQFFDLFLRNVKDDANLKKLHIEENYKNEVFNIAGELELVSAKVDTIRQQLERQEKEREEKSLSPEQVIIAMKEQVRQQLAKQIDSGKYIPATFIEIRDEKDLLRYSCHPLLFFRKEFDEIKNLDFRRLNHRLEKEHRQGFSVELGAFDATSLNLTLENHTQSILEIRKHLEKKDLELKQLAPPSWDLYTFNTKLGDRIEGFGFFLDRIILVTEAAGQGKTNFICDFVENFLVRRDIPCTFLTGLELSSTNIADSIARRILPLRALPDLGEILDNVRKHCFEKGRLYVIIIDGLNENLHVREFAVQLENVMSDIARYNFVKIILTCRTEYFEYNFANLKRFLDSGEMGHIESLNKRLGDTTKAKLLEAYLDHFRIGIKYLSEKAEKQLVDNFLLLRIFAETYRDQENLEFDNIYKEELFEKYFKLKCAEVHKRSQNNEFGVGASLDISAFLSSMTEYMLSHSQFADIPFLQIVSQQGDRDVYVRFLDENILVRRDIRGGSPGLFEDQEVVNFNFDEFRDYMIAQFLISKTYKSSREEFIRHLESLGDASPIKEGCTTFVFFLSHKSQDNELKTLVTRQKWYDGAFVRCIFSLRDNEVSESDLKYLKGLFLTSLSYSRIIANALIYRRFDTKRFNNLNIELLFSILQEMSATKCSELFYPVFESRTFRYPESELDHLIDQLEDMFQNGRATKSPRHRNLFRLLIYFFPIRSKAKYLFQMYLSQNTEEACSWLRTANDSKNEHLISEIKQFMHRYEIHL